MAGFSTGNNEHLIRSNLWSNELKDVLEADLMGMRYIKMITDFPDGDTLNIPSIGQAEVLDYSEGQAVKYTAMDTGNFTFTINKYKQSGTFIYEKMKQDSYYAAQLMASFVPKQHRALMAAIENDVLAVGPDGQTASSLNAINGANHRWVGKGTNETIAVKDFALARYALQKANVPLNNLVAIVDPSVEYALATQSNITNLINPNRNWENVIVNGLSTGIRFAFSIYGFDVYVSQYLKSSIAETIDSVSTTAGVANLFFSASSDVLPFVGLMRQPPKVDSEYNKDFQREEYVTTCRYGFKLYRPENFVCILTDTDQVS
jgi:hypothetical protein